MYGYDLEEDIDHVVVDSVPPYVLVPPRTRWPAATPPGRGRGAARAGRASRWCCWTLPHSSSQLPRFGAALAGVEPVRLRHRSAGFETVTPRWWPHGHGFALLNQRPSHELTYDGSRVVSLELRDPVGTVIVVLAWSRRPADPPRPAILRHLPVEVCPYGRPSRAGSRGPSRL